eukprot:4158717-Pyramimonas_sp.AAC.1
MGTFPLVPPHPPGALGYTPVDSWASPDRLASPAAGTNVCVAVGIGLIVSVVSVIKDESHPRLDLAVVPFRPCGSGVCSRLPIGTPEGEPSSD